jgi:hypothetical protein
MSPEERSETLDILFESTITINEWISFEVNFPHIEHPAIKKEVEKLHTLLPKIYIRALRLLSKIQKHCEAKEFKSRCKCSTTRSETTAANG